MHGTNVKKIYIQIFFGLASPSVRNYSATPTKCTETLHARTYWYTLSSLSITI